MNRPLPLNIAQYPTSERGSGKLRVLKHLRRCGAASRVEITQATGLTKAAITQITGQLVKEGIVHEDRPSPISRGRPRTQLRINSKAAFGIGIFPLLDGTSLTEIVDLQGQVVFSDHACFDMLDEFDQPEIQLANDLAPVLAKSGLSPEKIGNIAVALPAQVDRRGSVIHWLPSSARPQSMPSSFAMPIREALGIPVTLDNRASIIARAEHWFGRDDKSDSFTMVAFLEMGMNADRYVRGEIQSGAHGMNPAFAHVKVAFDGGCACHCGGEGCLTAYSSISGIVIRLRNARNEGELPFEDFAAYFTQACLDAKAGDRQAQMIFAQAGRALGTAIASHIHEHDPGHVAIASAWPQLEEMIGDEFHATLKRQTLPFLLEMTSVEWLNITNDIYRKGIAALTLESLYRG